jgi:hypothetical protein
MYTLDFPPQTAQSFDGFKNAIYSFFLLSQFKSSCQKSSHIGQKLR